MNCEICPRHCSLDEGQTGFCRARANVGGQIVCKNYGRLTALALDPIEKKPLKRFHPGSYILSAGSFGCNMRCPFCQNSDISMADDRIPTVEYSPGQLVAKAVEMIPRGNIGLAYTYNEPLIGYEYVRDCAALAREAGLVNVAVTNGMVCEAPIDALLPLMDAMNIDLKAFSQAFYDLAGGNLETVKATIERAVKACHVEVTTLVIPGLNDTDTEMEAEAQWLASLNPELPLHISRFFPRYHMTDRQPTPVATVTRLRAVADRYLRFVYTGNC
ncbi:MAG TPA: AmmeMemoRadiSam system radical SAM enzyme [Candidatus Limiplasma sp.]|nr:AmmeMemoRadiSam system radical SAM enzyme [Candidatus Limiplasma sp.]